MNVQEAIQSFRADRVMAEQLGVIFPEAEMFIPDDWRFNFDLAQDAQPALATSSNSAVPALLTTMIDPAVYEVLFAPNNAALIFGENRKGTWLDDTALFPTVEHEGEVSSYGDYSNNGRSGVNTNWPQRQAYLFQSIKSYGERELARAGLARINWVGEQDKACATIMGKFMNVTYFFGVKGLQNYGLLNDPGLSAFITPTIKAAGGTGWFVGNTPNATANEVYNDVVALFQQLVTQTMGLVNAKTKMTLAMSPASSVGLTFTNTFAVNVEDLLKKNFPNLTVETAVQYGLLTAANPQGSIAGNIMQLIVDEVEGQDVGYCAFNEKMRAHPIIREMSAYRQKMTGGSWGAIIREPFALAGMIGI